MDVRVCVCVCVCGGGGGCVRAYFQVAKEENVHAHRELETKQSKTPTTKGSRQNILVIRLITIVRELPDDSTEMKKAFCKKRNRKNIDGHRSVRDGG